MQWCRRSLYVLGLVFLFSCLNASTLRADDRKDLEKKLNARYKRTVLILRNFYTSKKLKFDREGHIMHKGETGTWTLYSHIEVDRIKVKKNKYEIHGKRISIVFQKGAPSYIRTKSKIRLEIGASSPVSETHFKSIARRIFFTSNEQLADALPAHWRPYLQGIKPFKIVESKKNTGGNKDLSIECVSCPDPVFTDKDLLPDIDGRIIIHGIVNGEGRLEKIRVLEKLQTSIDARILEAVRGWILTPYQAKVAYIIFTYSQNQDSASVQHSFVSLKNFEKPRCLSCPDPVYTPAARAAKLTGTVVLHTIISKDGRAHDFRITKALGMGLDDEAIKALRQWKFQPATIQGRPLPFPLYIEVSFHIF